MKQLLEQADVRFRRAVGRQWAHWKTVFGYPPNVELAFCQSRLYFETSFCHTCHAIRAIHAIAVRYLDKTDISLPAYHVQQLDEHNLG